MAGEDFILKSKLMFIINVKSLHTLNLFLIDQSSYDIISIMHLSQYRSVVIDRHKNFFRLTFRKTFVFLLLRDYSKISFKNSNNAVENSLSDDLIIL
jgi:hypothetical protein